MKEATNFILAHYHHCNSYQFFVTISTHLDLEFRKYICCLVDNAANIVTSFANFRRFVLPHRK